MLEELQHVGAQWEGAIIANDDFIMAHQEENLKEKHDKVLITKEGRSKKYIEF